MNNQITFSIITCTFNACQTLERTILSILSQSFPRIEFIIVDGGSTDGTLGIVERYRDRINIVVSEPDEGLYFAMNKGIGLSTGDYICFINAGDRLHSENTLENVAKLIATQATAPDVVYGDTAIVDINGYFKRMRRLSPPEHLSWKSFRNGMLVCHQSFFVRRENVLLYDTSYRFSSDFDWCIRILKQSEEILNTRLTLSDYLDEGMTTRNRKASLIERYRIMCSHYGKCSTILHHMWFILRGILMR